MTSARQSKDYVIDKKVTMVPSNVTVYTIISLFTGAYSCIFMSFKWAESRNCQLYRCVMVSAQKNTMLCRKDEGAE
jgi:hypothetical protein